KSAHTNCTRTYNWTIGKNVAKTLVERSGDQTTFNYTVDAKETGYADSGWTVTGKITVNNPNNWEAITANVTDTVDDGGVCVVSGGTNVSVPASGSGSRN